MSFKCIILAAGKSKRLGLPYSKVLLEVMGKSIIDRIIQQVSKINDITEIIVIVGFDKERVVEKIKKYSVTIVEQKEQRGTLDAVNSCCRYLNNYQGNVLILNGDIPLIDENGLRKFIDNFKKDISVGIAIQDNPQGYGRIVRNENDHIVKIIEEAEATEYEKGIKEINTGIYCFKWNKVTPLFKKIKKAKNGEYYLTDIIEVAYKNKLSLDGYIFSGESTLGVNRWDEFARVCEIQRNNIIKKYLAQGIKIPFISSVYIEEDVEIGQGTTINPFTVIEKNVKIGRNCAIGPFARLRSGTQLDDGVIIGNFMELKNTKMGKNSKAKHLSYLGDVIIGKNVNIGCGTITANYDGKKHNITVIEDNVTTGSGTILIAPVRMGKNSQTGAGAVVPKHHDVPENQVVVGIPAKSLKNAKNEKTD